MKMKSKYHCWKLWNALLLVFAFTVFLFCGQPETVKASIFYSSLTPRTLTSGTTSDYNKAVSQKFQCDGTRLISVKLSQPGNLYMKVYAENTGAHPILFFRTPNASDLPVTASCFCTAGNEGCYFGEANTYLSKGNYYMQLPEDNYQITSYFYPQNNRTLSLDTWTAAYSDYIHPTYFTYKPKNNGYLTLYEEALVDTGFSAGVTLCNSKNTPIVNTMSNHSKDDKIVYALKKGNTYKIKIGAVDSNISHFYRIKATFTKRTERSGSKKSKAESVTFDKTAKGMVLAEDSPSKSDWYKITNPKTQKIKINYSGSITSGTMLLDVYRSNGKKFASYAIISSVGENNEYVLVDKNGSITLAKGTYYFRITKSRKEASGIYSLKMSALK